MTDRTIGFEVRGAGTFPFDMLRYDCCWPATQVDSNHLYDAAEHALSARTVAMESGREPTPERWESFGWRIVGRRYG